MREIRQRRYDGWYVVWNRRDVEPWECVGVFSERENAIDTFVNGPGWPFHVARKH